MAHNRVHYMWSVGERMFRTWWHVHYKWIFDLLLPLSADEIFTGGNQLEAV